MLSVISFQGNVGSRLYKDFTNFLITMRKCTQIFINDLQGLPKFYHQAYASINDSSFWYLSTVATVAAIHLWSLLCSRGGSILFGNSDYWKSLSVERSSSLSSKRSMMIDRYASSKYTDSLHNEMFVSPPSRSGSNISIANDHQDYKVSKIIFILFRKIKKINFD